MKDVYLNQPKQLKPKNQDISRSQEIKQFSCLNKRRNFQTKFDSPFETDFHVLPEAAGVVVAYGLGISERLEQRASLQDLLGDHVVTGRVDGSQVLHDQLGALRLTSAALATTLSKRKSGIYLKAGRQRK